MAGDERGLGDADAGADVDATGGAGVAGAATDMATDAGGMTALVHSSSPGAPSNLWTATV